MIGISADFDPVHHGHVKLIQKAREVADRKGTEVVIYLNKGYSANHAPFFVDYDARKRMALEAGADRVVPIEGLHHRLTMAYTVPIRIAMMIQDGVRDYVDAADVSPTKIMKYASNFVKQGIFSGIPRNLPNRNVIRWYAVNEFLGGVLGDKMEFHFIPESKVGEEKISGRIIRREILENNLELPKSIRKLLPHSTVKILQEEIDNDNIPGERNLEVLLDRLNNYSRPRLLNIAHLNSAAVEEIVQGRKYRKEAPAWASFRKAGYGPVLTRLALSCVEEDVTRQEVFDLIKHYQKEGIIPSDQKVERVIGRAWFVASSVDKGMESQEAHERFRKGDKISQNAPYTVDAGIHLRSFELSSLQEGLPAQLYVDKRGMIACLLKTVDRKIKSPLKLPARDATYLRLLLDSQIVPLQGNMVRKKRGWRVRIMVG
ncbi:MAG: adenylyltransferase/cytidyltransferase family protein [Methanobacteriaceae archaeon]